MSQCVVLTRPQGLYDGNQRLSEKLKAIGLETLEISGLTCCSIPIEEHVLNEIEGSPDGDGNVWFVLLSPTAVHVVASLSATHQQLASSISKAKIACQGRGTAGAVQACFGRNADFIPTTFIAEEFSQQLASVLSPADTLLVPQSRRGRNVIGPALKSQGFSVCSWASYRFDDRALSAQELDALSKAPEKTVVIFMSPSAVSALVKQARPELANKRLLSIGPITSQAIKSAGLPIWREASEHSEEGIITVLSDLCDRE